MWPWLGLLLLTGLFLGTSALPPELAVKHLTTKIGPYYQWQISSEVSNPLPGPLYPGHSGTARVTLRVRRASTTKGFLVTGKVVVRNPPDNLHSMTITALKASFNTAMPAAPPAPQQLDCPQRTLLPGDSLSCNFKLDINSSSIATMTPFVVVKDQPQVQGEPLQLNWPDEEESVVGNKQEEDAAVGCALIQEQMLAGDLSPMVRTSTSEEFSDLLRTGLEVCSDTSLTYDVHVGPFEESSGLCGNYTVTSVSEVRLAAGSIGSSTVSQYALPVSLTGCQRQDLFGGHKPALTITKLTLAKLVTYEWAANPVSSTNTTSPATAKYSGMHAVDVAVEMQRTVGKTELVIMGEVTVSNTQQYPYILPAEGVRMALSKADSSEQEFITVTCPMVGSSIVVRPMVANTPGTLVCEFKAPITEFWKKGLIQAQLHALSRTTYEIDSGPPKAFDFDDAASVEMMHQGECLSLQLTRVTEQADLKTANDNTAVAGLARTMGGDRFKLMPMGLVDLRGGRRIPPDAADDTAQPLVVCGNETVAWRETYGPWSEYDCGPNMALMGLSGRPLTGPGDMVRATLAFPVSVQNCTITPTVRPIELRASAQEISNWHADQTIQHDGHIAAPKNTVVSVTYDVDYKRTTSIGAFKVRGLFKLVNTHAASLNVEEVMYSISRPEGPPITGKISCTGTMDEAYSLAASAPGAAMLSSTSQLTSQAGRGSVAALGAAKYVPVKIKLAAVKAVDNMAAGASRPAQYADGDTEYDYEQGGDGPQFCSFEAQLPDDFPTTVKATVVTDQGSKMHTVLGSIDWTKADVSQSSQCALASFKFVKEPNLLQPASIDGHAPPASAVKICEPKHYTFVANFGPWTGSGWQCGVKHATSVATVGIPATAAVTNSEEQLHVDITGCKEPLPMITIDATQTPIKGSYVWSITRRIAPVGAGGRKGGAPVTVAGPSSPRAEPAVLTLSAKHNGAGSQPGAYARFNQTIIVKRTKPAYSEKGEQLFEVKGEVKLLNTADKPLRLKQVLAKIVCDSGKKKPVYVKAKCPKHCYSSDQQSEDVPRGSYLTIPSNTITNKPIICQFGTIVPGPASVSVHGVVIASDSRKAKAKHSIHLDLSTDFLKPSMLGSCIRVREAQRVHDSVTGTGVHYLLVGQGQRIPEEGMEICKSKVFSFVGRIGPLESYEGEGCQAVTYESLVEGVPTSGYQGKLKSPGFIEVHTKSCKQPEEDDGSEDNSKTYKGSDYSRYVRSSLPPNSAYDDDEYGDSPEADGDGSAADGWEGLDTGNSAGDGYEGGGLDGNTGSTGSIDSVPQVPGSPPSGTQPSLPGGGYDDGSNGVGADYWYHGEPSLPLESNGAAELPQLPSAGSLPLPGEQAETGGLGGDDAPLPSSIEEYIAANTPGSEASSWSGSPVPGGNMPIIPQDGSSTSGGGSATPSPGGWTWGQGYGGAGEGMQDDLWGMPGEAVTSSIAPEASVGLSSQV